MKLLILACVCFIISSSLAGQETQFGKVSQTELEEQFYPLDSTAPAAFLFKKRATFLRYFSDEGFKVVTHIHHRIKIYDQDGFKYGTKVIPLYQNSSSKEKLIGLKATSYALKNGKIEKSKLTKSGQFYTELSKSWNQKSFTMPNLKIGSVIEYKYELRSPFISNIDEFVFQHDIPVKRIIASMNAPEYFNFRINTKGFVKVEPQIELSQGATIIDHKPDRSSNNSITKGGVSKSFYTNSATLYTSILTKYKLEDVPALKEEPYVSGIRNYRSGVSYELSYTDFPDSGRKNYSTDWKTVVKRIYENSNFGPELKKTDYFEDDIDRLITGIKEPEKKISAIYGFLKSKVKWNEVLGKYTRDGVKKAYKLGSGNIAEINLMLTSMLRYAGLEANPVLVSTRANGIPLFPTRTGYNYVVSHVQLDKSSILLDASDLYSEPNVLPFRTYNWEGRIVKKDGNSETISLYSDLQSSTRIYVNTELSETGIINGKIRFRYDNHAAVAFRKQYFETNEEDYLNKLESEFGQIEIDDFEVKNAELMGNSPIVTYAYVLEDGTDLAANKLYFAPLSFLKKNQNPFTLEQREFPVDFGYPFTESIVSSIALPEGYRVQNLPESSTIVLPDEIGSFEYLISNTKNTIQLKVTTKMNNAVVAPIYYQSLKEYYKKMIEKMNEKVVLSKV